MEPQGSTHLHLPGLGLPGHYHACFFYLGAKGQSHALKLAKQAFSLRSPFSSQGRLFNYRSEVRFFIYGNNLGVYSFEIWGSPCKDLVSPNNSSADILKSQFNICQAGGLLGHPRGRGFLTVCAHCIKASERR